jgi:hypothetical protein
MMSHLRYLRYVLRHKWFVLRAGVVINGYSLAWLWRLLVHDLSKFGRAEWGPYVAEFYDNDRMPIAAERKRRFNAAWLHHLHANPHHWQHWVLKQDDGREITLVMPVAVVNEMVADWLAAGRKVNRAHTMASAVAETIVWYTQNGPKMLLRADVRAQVEATLLGLADKYDLGPIGSMLPNGVPHAGSRITRV